jgi:hypothetical protein
MIIYKQILDSHRPSKINASHQNYEILSLLVPLVLTIDPLTFSGAVYPTFKKKDSTKVQKARK